MQRSITQLGIVLAGFGMLAVAQAAHAATSIILTLPTNPDTTTPPLGTLIVPMGINDNGVLSGYERLYGTYATTVTGTASSLTFITPVQVANGTTAVAGDGMLDTLPTSSSQSGLSWGFGINSTGAIAGLTDYNGNNNWIAAYSGPVAGGQYPTMNPISNGTGNATTTFGYYPSGTAAKLSFGAAINNNGVVVGGAMAASADEHAFVFTAPTQAQPAGVLTDLTPGTGFGMAYAVDSTGTLVAGFTDASPGSGLSTDKLHKLATIWTQATSGPNTGQWTSATLASLGGSGQSIAYGMQTQGGAVKMVVGISETSGLPDATAWVPNGSGGYTAIDLNGPASGSATTLLSPVYYNPFVVGVSSNVRNPLNFFTTSSSLEKVNSCADAVNNEGDIVGYSYFANGDTQVPGDANTSIPNAFLCTLDVNNNPTMIDLNEYAPAGYHFTEATAVDNAGDVVGYGTGPNGEIGFELQGLFPSAVPEPTTFAITLLGSLGLLGRRRRREA